jgi:hypothetical protein
MQTATAMLQSVKAETEQLRAQAEAFKMIAEAQKAQVEAQMAGFTAQIQAMATISASKQRDVSEESESETSKPDGTKTVKRTRKVPSAQSVPSNESSEEGSEMEVPEMEELPPNPVLEKLEMLLQNQIKIMEASKDPMSKTPQQDLTGIFDKLSAAIEGVNSKVDTLSQPKPRKKRGAPKIERGPDGKVVAVDGIPVTRDENGLMAGLAEAPPEE